MGYVSKKLKEHEYLIPCSIEDSGMDCEYKVIFPCYNDQGVLGIESIVCNPDHVDEDKGLCRADFLRWNSDVNTVLVDMNGLNCRVHKDSLIKNLLD